MNAEKWRALRSLFDQAIALTTSARSRFIREASTDPEIAECLRSMVQHQQAATNLLNGPLLSQTRFLEYLSGNLRTLREGDVLDGRFRILRFIAEGGMGEVYAAEDLALGGDVAIKTIRPALYNDASLALFKQEIQTARRVTHENVARIHDIFFHKVGDEIASQPIAFLSMELLEGETLASHIRNTGPFREADALPIVQQIASGLSKAHAVGVIHRDLKSSNIMLVGAPETPLRAAITDFGLAILSKKASVPESPGDVHFPLEGTPAYMAPEQVTGDAITPAADIYAFGVVLFEMMTGQLPFRAEAAREVAEMRLTQSAPLPRDFAPELDKRWADAIHACLRRDPGSRPQHPEQIVAAIRSNKLVARRIAIGALASAGVALVAWKWSAPKPLNPKAVQHFKTGREFAGRRNHDGLTNAVREFESATGLEPRYTDAWVELAEAYSAMENFGFGKRQETMSKALDSANRACSLEPHNGRALGVLGYVISLDVRRWRTAEALLKKASERAPLDPDVCLWYGAYLGKLGRSEEAFKQLNTGLDESPTSFVLNQQHATQLLRARRYAEFLTKARKLVRVQPYEFNSHVTLARALMYSDQFEEALVECKNVETFGGGEMAVCLRGSVEALRKNTSQARAIAERVRSYWISKPLETHVVAILFAHVGEPAAACELLQAGFGRGDSSILGAPTNPAMDSLKGHPEYLRFLRMIDWPRA